MPTPTARDAYGPTIGAEVLGMKAFSRRAGRRSQAASIVKTCGAAATTRGAATRGSDSARRREKCGRSLMG